MRARPAKRRTRPTAFIEAVHDAERLKITKREAAALRRWNSARGGRVPRWLPRMQQALRLVAAATEMHGRQRRDILVEAAKIVVALREPRTDRVPFERLSFRRSEWLLEVAIGTLGNCVGCLASGASLADKQIFARVKRAVNEADPIGLLRAGAPDDEYDPEIDEIACRVPEPVCQTVAQTHAMVHGVFVKWFGEGIAGPRGAYRKLAAALHASRPRRGRPRVRVAKHLTQDQAMRLAREVIRKNAKAPRRLAKRTRRRAQEIR